MSGTMNSNNSRQRGGFSSLVNLVASELSDNLIDALAMGYLEVVSLRDCTCYYEEEAKKLQGVAVAGFVLSVRKNLEPRNKNDNYIVVQGLINEKNEPIAVNGESFSRIIHTKTIDDDLIKVLNGRETVVFHGNRGLYQKVSDRI